MSAFAKSRNTVIATNNFTRCPVSSSQWMDFSPTSSIRVAGELYLNRVQGDHMAKSFKLAEFDQVYASVKKAHSENLEALGVKLTKAYDSSGRPTKNALVLCILAKYIGVAVSKTELTSMVREFYPKTTDVQQGRHLARQDGWFIASGTRRDAMVDLANDEYMLISLESAYPTFRGSEGHRAGRHSVDFESLKQDYEYRCATCGSSEGEPNYLNPAVPTILQEGHMDPTKPLESGNIIPQCDQCNRAYLDKFLFDGQGRVSDINIESHYWNRKYKAYGKS
jgi:hypothetical protein